MKDKEIELLKAKAEKLKEQKKGLMQQFINRQKTISELIKTSSYDHIRIKANSSIAA